MSATRRRGLGRGLDALIAGPGGAGDSVRALPVDQLHPNRVQPRSRFDDAGLEELAESIRAQGVIQPVVVTARAAGGWTLVAGERRWRAAQRAGLTEIPAVVREVAGDRELLELALVENLQRADLNAIEEAEAYQMLAQRFGLSQDEIAERVGKARPTVTNTLRLLKLPPAVADLVRDGRLSAGQARPLIGLDDDKRQLRLAERAVDEGLSARAVERLVSPPAPSKKKRRARKVEVHTAAAEERLTRRLQARVEIHRRGKGGTLRIHFHSEEELMRIYDLLMPTKGKEGRA